MKYIISFILGLNIIIPSYASKIPQLNLEPTEQIYKVQSFGTKYHTYIHVYVKSDSQIKIYEISEYGVQLFAVINSSVAQ